ncbi:hypothetical protein [Treponema sp. R80B11-R83G3]
MLNSIWVIILPVLSEVMIPMTFGSLRNLPISTGCKHPNNVNKLHIIKRNNDNVLFGGGGVRFTLNPKRLNNGFFVVNWAFIATFCFIKIILLFFSIFVKWNLGRKCPFLQENKKKCPK